MSVTELIAKLQEISDTGYADYRVVFWTGGAQYQSNILPDDIYIDHKEKLIVFEQEY